MKPEELRSIVRAKIDRNNTNDTGSTHRIDAIRFYKGEPFGDEEEFSSKVVSRDVAESVDSMMPALMKIFAAGERVVQFEPFGPEDEEIADQSTDYVNLLWERAGGFRLFHDWFKNALLYRLGTVKIWWQEEEKTERHAFSGLDDEQFQALRADDDLELIEHTQIDVEGDDLAAPFHDAVFIRRIKKGVIKVAAIPPDEFLWDRECQSENDGKFFAHRSKKTLSDLIEMGFDRKTVEGLSSDEDGQTEAERVERHPDIASGGNSDAPPIDPSMREVWVTEAYLPVDFDGDGVAEWRQVTVAGNDDEILENVEVDDHAFACVTPTLMPNALEGRSVFDQTKDLQEIASTLWRQMLNNLYLSNEPEMMVVEGQANIEDLLRPAQAGGIKRVRSVGAITPIAVPFVAKDSFPMLEWVQQVREQRTGVRRFDANLDADTLNKTATGVAAVQESGKERLELIARVFAETGVKRAFRRILKLIVKHQDRPETMRLRNKWVQMDPRAWNADMDMSVVVGLGTGNKDQQVAQMMQMIGLDGTIAQGQGGMNGPILTWPNVYRKLEKLCEAMGLKTAEGYYTNPAEAQMQPQEPRPDPKMIEAQAKIEAKKVETQATIQLNREKAAADIQIERERAQFEAQLAQQRAEFEAGLALRQQQLEEQMAREDQQVQHALAERGQRMGEDTKRMTAVRPGGKVG